jgi:hypothetical protein
LTRRNAGTYGPAVESQASKAFGSPWALAMLFTSLAAIAGCGVDLPPRLPSTKIHDRTAARVELVDFVISDRGRADKVKALYLETERLMLGALGVEAREQAKLGGSRFHDESEARASFRVSREAELGALERYVAVQMEIRRLTTPEEFARLDAIK